jgi:xylulokinase
MRRAVLGVDCSTTAVKAIAWSDQGEALAEGRASLSLENPSPDAYEQDADAYWRGLAQACQEAAQKAREAGVAIGALCLTHQRETFVLTDDDGAPLAPAIVWMDSRATAEVPRAVAALGAGHLHERTGKPPCVTPSLYKLLDLARRRPDLAARRPWALDVHAFLARRLVGRHVTSLASADPMGMIAMSERSWAPEILAYAGLDAARMPELAEPGAVLGGLLPGAAAALGLPAGLAVVAGAGDGQAAGLGVGIGAPGVAYVNLGTALVSGVLSPEYRIDPAFRTLYGAAPGTYFLESDLKGGTFSFDWLAGRLLGGGEGPGARLAALEAEASRLGPSADGLLFLPYLAGVMNPYWDDAASGALVGLRGSHGPAHVYRAVLEGLLLELRLNLEGLEAAGPVSELRVTGGGARGDLACQLLADITGRPATRSATPEATCLGAGLLGAVAAGLHPDLATAVAAMTRSGQSFTPGPRSGDYDPLFAIYRGLYPALRGALGGLAALRRG